MVPRRVSLGLALRPPFRKTSPSPSPSVPQNLTLAIASNDRGRGRVWERGEVEAETLVSSRAGSPSGSANSKSIAIPMPILPTAKTSSRYRHRIRHVNLSEISLISHAPVPRNRSTRIGGIGHLRRFPQKIHGRASDADSDFRPALYYGPGE